MKALLLAGGTGSRLHPLTLGVNKHLLPVGHQPMIGHSLTFLRDVGVSSVVIITTPEDLSGYGRLIGSNRPPYTDFENIYIAVQNKPAGIADAIKYGNSFVGSDDVLVMLADNIYDRLDKPQISEIVRNDDFLGCHVWTTITNRPQDVGILVLENGKPIMCVEKPKEFVGNQAITGLYLFDNRVWELIDNLEPSTRGEYEIIDVLNQYLELGFFTHSSLFGPWMDMGGSLEEYLTNSARVAQCTY
jgi:glucose-1-phosphate thymidylyltransferase